MEFRQIARHGGREETESPMVASQQFSKLLRDWSRGDRSALNRLTPLIYSELRKLARYHMSQEGPGHTLQPTALINEAYLKLAEFPEADWKGRKQFYSAASKIMRHVLIDHARKKRSLKRGRDFENVPLDIAKLHPGNEPTATDLIAFDEALKQLAEIDPRKVEVVEHWFFAGLTVEQIAATLDVATSTVNRDLDFARPFLASRLAGMERK